MSGAPSSEDSMPSNRAADVTFTSLTFNWRGALCKKSAQDMRSLGISMSTLEVMPTRVLEWGHRARRESRDGTWIRLDQVPSGSGRALDEFRPGNAGGGRRHLAVGPPQPASPLAAGPPQPASPLAAGRQGRLFHSARKRRERRRRPGPAGTGAAAPICQ